MPEVNANTSSVDPYRLYTLMVMYLGYNSAAKVFDEGIEIEFIYI